MRTLAELRDTAPRSFDRDLIDALSGGASSAPAELDRVAALENALAIAAQGLAASQLELIDLRQQVEAMAAAMRALAEEAERKLRVA